MSSLSDQKNALFGNAKPSTGSSDSSRPTRPTTTSKTAHMKPSSTAGMKAGVPIISPAAKAKKMEEAKSFSERGMKFLQTSMFQWNPDHLAAAPLFEKSADTYQKSGELDTAYLMYMKAIESHELSGILSAAALAAAKASGVAKSQGDVLNTAKMLITSAEYWGSNGDIPKYAEVLSKAATEYEAIDPKEAISVYQKSIDTIFPADTPNAQIKNLHATLLDTMRKYFTLLVTEGLLNEALALANRMILVFTAFELEASLCKIFVSITILHLTLGDVVRAQQVYLQEHLNSTLYIRSKECELADSLIMAFNNVDVDILDEAQAGAEIHHLDPEIRRLGKELSLLAAEYADDTEELTDQLDQIAVMDALSDVSDAATAADVAVVDGGGSGSDSSSGSGSESEVVDVSDVGVKVSSGGDQVDQPFEDENAQGSTEGEVAGEEDEDEDELDLS